ncbi:uncharacterized protein LOC122250644 [Penaeus japonicus]|uniref:uncharacterized protein LOC122250644 n=1 Tax=Penaeus japonicus TaxID=27405 RepID=UPI001C7132D9|nr:uncharacterized protein LOC122250644 [Penaeus japonicus]
MEICEADSDVGIIKFHDASGMANYSKHLYSKEAAESLNTNNKNNAEDTNYLPRIYQPSSWEESDDSDDSAKGFVSYDVSHLQSIAQLHGIKDENDISLFNSLWRYNEQSKRYTNPYFSVHNLCDRQFGDQIQDCHHEFPEEQAPVQFIKAVQSSLNKWRECRYYRMKLNRSSIISTENGFSEFIHVNKKVLHFCWQREIVPSKKNAKPEDHQSTQTDPQKRAFDTRPHDVISDSEAFPNENADLIDKVVEIHNRISKGQCSITTPPKDPTQTGIRVATPHDFSGIQNNLGNSQVVSHTLATGPIQSLTFGDRCLQEKASAIPKQHLENLPHKHFLKSIGSSLLTVRNDLFRSSTGSLTGMRLFDPSGMVRNEENVLKTHHQHQGSSAKDVQQDHEDSQSSCSEDQTYRTRETEETQRKAKKNKHDTSKGKRHIKSDEHRRGCENGRSESKEISKERSEKRKCTKFYAQKESRSEKETRNTHRRRESKVKNKETDKYSYARNINGKKGRKQEGYNDIISEKEINSTGRGGVKRKCNQESFHLIKEMSSNQGSFAEELFKRMSKRHQLESKVIRNDQRLTVEEGQERQHDTLSPERHRESSPESAVAKILEKSPSQPEEAMDRAVRIPDANKLICQKNGGKDNLGNATKKEKIKKGNEDEGRKGDPTEEGLKHPSESVPLDVYKGIKIKAEPVTLEGFTLESGNAQSTVNYTSDVDKTASIQLDSAQRQSEVQTQNVHSGPSGMLVVKTENVEFGLEKISSRVKTENVESDLENMSVVKTEPDFLCENLLNSTEMTVCREQLQLEDMAYVEKTETFEEEVDSTNMEDIRKYFNTIGMPFFKKEY